MSWSGDDDVNASLKDRELIADADSTDAQGGAQTRKVGLHERLTQVTHHLVRLRR